LIADHALIDMPNVIVTPHIAFNTTEAKREITQTTLDNINAFVSGTPQNTITV
jgi:D-lactate dehydrogenase